jgi:hypothetical protein
MNVVLPSVYIPKFLLFIAIFFENSTYNETSPAMENRLFIHEWLSLQQVPVTILYVCQKGILIGKSE